MPRSAALVRKSFFVEPRALRRAKRKLSAPRAKAQTWGDWQSGKSGEPMQRTDDGRWIFARRPALTGSSSLRFARAGQCPCQRLTKLTHYPIASTIPTAKAVSTGAHARPSRMPASRQPERPLVLSAYQGIRNGQAR